MIGRTANGDPRLSDERVSRRHLLIEPTTEGWAAVDISTWGTWQNGWRIGRILVHEESHLRLGAPDGPVLTLVPHPARQSSGIDVSVTSAGPSTGQHSPFAEPAGQPQAGSWGQQQGPWDGSARWDPAASPAPGSSWDPAHGSATAGVSWDQQISVDPSSSWDPAAGQVSAGAWQQSYAGSASAESWDGSAQSVPGLPGTDASQSQAGQPAAWSPGAAQAPGGSWDQAEVAPPWNSSPAGPSLPGSPSPGPQPPAVPIGPWDPQAMVLASATGSLDPPPVTAPWEQPSPPSGPLPGNRWDQNGTLVIDRAEALGPAPDGGRTGDGGAHPRSGPTPVAERPTTRVPAPSARRQDTRRQDERTALLSQTPSVPRPGPRSPAPTSRRDDRLVAARRDRRDSADPAAASPARHEDKRNQASSAAGPATPSSKVTRHHSRPTVLPKKARSAGPQMPPSEDDVPDTGAGLGRIHTLRQGKTVIGRALSSDIVVGDLLTSREHAALYVTPDRVEIVDLGSANGTFVNGRRVERAQISVGDFFSIGHHVFHTGVATSDQRAVPTRLVEYLDRGDVTFQVDGLCVDAGGTRLLHDVTFRLPGRSVLGVIGPSGAGKSTLLNALTGFRPANIGTVRYSGRDLYAEYDELRRRIGYVPQDDILHTTLTVRQALEYGAQLRFPAETTKAERTRRIEEVLVELGLTNTTAGAAPRGSGREADSGRHRRRSAGGGDLDILDDLDEPGGSDDEAPKGVDIQNLKVSKLSGGQRKRTSVALELLTQPTLLYLDEPTSGLDPGLDKEVMESLRKLADGGRTVVVVTHSVANLDLCDYLLVLAKGGHVAYFGPPAHALEFFGKESWSDAFQLLKNPQAAVKLANRYRNSKYFIRGSASVPKPHRAPLESIRQQSVLAQALTLSRRYVKVIASDPSYLRLLVAYPIVLGLIPRTLPAPFGLAASTNPAKANVAAGQVLLVLILMACFMGMSNSIRELVKEREIYRRERGIGLSTVAYIGSKVAVLGAITAAQSVVLTMAGLAGMKTSSGGVLIGMPLPEILIAVAATAIASAMMGLVVSALVDNADKTLPPLVVVAMAQLVFMGGMMPLAGKVGLEQFSWLFPARWGYGASASVIDLVSIQKIGDERFAPGVPVDALWKHSAGTYLTDLFVIVLIAAISAVIAARLLRRLDPQNSQRARPDPLGGLLKRGKGR